MDVEQHWTWTTETSLYLNLNYWNQFRVQGLCEIRGGCPGLPDPNSPYGLCGREATLNLNVLNQQRSRNHQKNPSPKSSSPASTNTQLAHTLVKITRSGCCVCVTLGTLQLLPPPPPHRLLLAAVPHAPPPPPPPPPPFATTTTTATARSAADTDSGVCAGFGARVLSSLGEMRYQQARNAPAIRSPSCCSFSQTSGSLLRSTARAACSWLSITMQRIVAVASSLPCKHASYGLVYESVAVYGAETRSCLFVWLCVCVCVCVCVWPCVWPCVCVTVCVCVCVSLRPPSLSFPLLFLFLAFSAPKFKPRAYLFLFWGVLCTCFYTHTHTHTHTHTTHTHKNKRGGHRFYTKPLSPSPDYLET